MPLSIEAARSGLTKIVNALTQKKDAYVADIKPFVDGEEQLFKFLWEAAPPTMEQMTDEYIQLRDRRSALKEAYDLADADLKKRMAMYDVRMLQVLKANNINSAKTDNGTAFIKTKRFFSCADWPSYWAWVAKTGNFDMLEKRPATRALEAYVSEHNMLPPGINMMAEDEVIVRRS